MIGRHGGAGRLGKALALGSRSAWLARPVWKFRPDLAVAHGSVDLAVLSQTFFIPSAQMQDYEFAGLAAEDRLAGGEKRVLVGFDPGRAPGQGGSRENKLVRFPGLKGGLLPGRFRNPIRPSRKCSGIDLERVLVIVRPPPRLPPTTRTIPYEKVIDRLAGADGVSAVIIPHRRPAGAGQGQEFDQPDRSRPGSRCPEF